MQSHKRSTHLSNVSFSEQLLNEQLRNFLEAIEKNQNIVIHQMCEKQPLRDWICGNRVNFGTTANPKFISIPLSSLTVLFEKVLKSANSVAIDLIWQTNRALRFYANGNADDFRIETEKDVDDKIIIFFQSVIASKQYWLIETIWYGNRRLHNAIKKLHADQAIELILKIGNLDENYHFFISYLNWLDNPLLLIKLLTSKHEQEALIKCKPIIIRWISHAKTISEYKQTIIQYLLILIEGNPFKINESWHTDHTLRLLLTGNKIYNENHTMFWNIEPEDLLDFFMIAISSKNILNCIAIWHNNLTLQFFIRKFGNGLNQAYYLLSEALILFHDYQIEPAFEMMINLITNMNNEYAINEALKFVKEKYPEVESATVYFGLIEKKLWLQREYLRSQNAVEHTRLSISEDHKPSKVLLRPNQAVNFSPKKLMMPGFFQIKPQVNVTSPSNLNPNTSCSAVNEKDKDFDIHMILEEEGLNLDDEQLFSLVI